MKKIILFMSAVAMFAAGSCNQAEIDNTNSDSTKFVAYSDVDTKTTLNGVSTEWVVNDAIDINGAMFSTGESGVKATFMLSDGEAPEAPYYAGYPYNVVYNNGEEGVLCFNFGNEHTLVSGNICSDVLAVSYSESEKVLNFKNVVSLIKFTVPEIDGDVEEIRISANETLAGDIAVSYNNGDPIWTVDGDVAYNEIVLSANNNFKKGEYYYVPVLPGNKTNLTVTINETVVAAGLNLTLERNKIHNVGTLPSTEVQTIYLKPNVWNIENAWFSAHFWGNQDVDVKMSDPDGDGIYEVVVPNGSTGVIFCRMNYQYTDFDWDVKDGEEVVEDHVWNQTEDLDLSGTADNKTYFVISGWGEDKSPGAWKTFEDATAAPTIGLVGSFQGWSVEAPIAMIDNGDGWIVAKGVELYKTDEFKFATGNSWDNPSYGTSEVTTLENNVETEVVTSNSQNMKVSKNGKYDIYFNLYTKKVKVECVEEYTDLKVNITIDNKANWTPLTITLWEGDQEIVSKATVTGNKYSISGDYIGSSLKCQLFSGSKQSEMMSISVTKDGATVTLEETIIKLKVQLNTANAKQWWGNTMKIHAWGTGTSFDTSWPGNTMTSEGNYTWSIIVPSELVGKTINFLVHNGNGWQSSDSNVTIKAEGNTVTGKSIGIN